jgi:hypothetical protein
MNSKRNAFQRTFSCVSSAPIAISPVRILVRALQSRNPAGRAGARANWSLDLCSSSPGGATNEAVVLHPFGIGGHSEHSIEFQIGNGARPAVVAICHAPNAEPV